jgi:tetratricopeptide (TPR) repeat protein
VTSPADGNAARAKYLRLVDPATDHPSARVLIDEGRALDKLGRRKEARARYEEALESLDPPAPSVASMLLRWIARTHEVDADYATAAACAERAVAMAEEADDRNALGHALNVLAAVRWRQGDLDEADRLFHEALKRGTSTTDPRLQVDVMTNLGSLAKIRGDFREALRCYEEALAHGRLHSLLDNILGTLNNLGIANMALRRLDAAEDAFTEALTIAERARRALDPDPARGQLRLAADREGRLREAKRRCDRADVARVAARRLARQRGGGEGLRHHRSRDGRPAASRGAPRARARDGERGERSRVRGRREPRARRAVRSPRPEPRDAAGAQPRARLLHAAARAPRARDVGRRMARLEGDFLDVVRQWSESIESKDQHTLGHCERVADLAGALAAKAGSTRARSSGSASARCCTTSAS